MTTNVYDITQQVMTGDSRWSIYNDSWPFTVFVDDTGFDKLFSFKTHGIDYAVMFAGCSVLINDWKEWLKNGGYAGNPVRPAVYVDDRTITICLVNVATNQILMEYGQDIVIDDARFAGSGARHAEQCWVLNKCAKKAVGSAMESDPCTGGTVKFFELATLSNNLDLTTTVDILKSSFLDKGTVMYKTATKGTVLPFREAAAKDTEVQAVMDDVASGRITSSAPCGAMHKQWPNEKENELDEALKKIFL
ncbi:MAG: hypothetical protein WC696_00490 [Candidatus Methylopumilus sp.]|jgi:hypothetical protein